MRANGRAASCDCRDLGRNKLTGPIPPEVSKLTGLSYLCVVLFLHDVYGCMRMLCSRLAHRARVGSCVVLHDNMRSIGLSICTIRL